ncbi:MAG: hypothetical protein ABIQ00_15550 [Chitinophagaceae bacterium]
MHILQVQVTPYPVPVNSLVTVTVHATDETGANVVGLVVVDSTGIGNTNTPISHTFKSRKKLISTKPREWDIIYPTGEVNAMSYAKVEIDFGFPT